MFIHLKSGKFKYENKTQTKPKTPYVAKIH